MVHIVIPKERRPYEYRVSATPEIVKKFIALGATVTAEKDAGLRASYTDEAYLAAGATIAETPQELYAKADVILKVDRPLLKGEGDIDEVSLMPKGAILMGSLNYAMTPESQKAYEAQKLTVIALELLPRITRAQSMDILSSQSNLAGYKAVLEGANLSSKVVPMMMTAAGTITPARVLVLGAGVAGLQAIATAKRLGAIVLAFDVRVVAKEQVQSLGAKFVEVPASSAGETAGGYAKEMDDDYKKRQAELLKETLKDMDLVITTALIPGRPAPLLITEDMLAGMKRGAVVVDLAAQMGGNCAKSQDQKILDVGGVLIFGCSNLPARIARDASPLYAKNLYHYFELIWNKDQKKIDFTWSDEIIQKTVKLLDGISPTFEETNHA